jgi:cell division protein FtsB
VRAQVAQLGQLEDRNRRLKQLVADLTLDREAFDLHT